MIIYPVSPESRWTTWDITEAEIIKRDKKWPVANGGPITSQDPNIVWLLQVTAPEPAYDPATHYIVSDGGVTDLPGNTITSGWVVMPLDQSSLDRAAMLALLRSMPDILRLHDGNNNDRLVRLEDTLANLIELNPIFSSSGP